MSEIEVRVRSIFTFLFCSLKAAGNLSVWQKKKLVLVSAKKKIYAGKRERLSTFTILWDRLFVKEPINT